MKPDQISSVADSVQSQHEGILSLHSQKAKAKWTSSKRKRGPARALMPSVRHLQILGATKTETYERIAARFQISRQRIGQIVQRWKSYVPIRSLRPPKSAKVRCKNLPRK